jgi:hypothetical protein
MVWECECLGDPQDCHQSGPAGQSAATSIFGEVFPEHKKGYKPIPRHDILLDTFHGSGGADVGRFPTMKAQMALVSPPVYHL